MHKIASFKNFFRGRIPPNPYSHASQAPQKLANPAYVHGLLLRNLFEEMRS